MDRANNKTSFLVSSQLPEFVRRDHPLFVQFLEEYYKFLEQDGETSYVTKRFSEFYDIDIISADINYDKLEGEEHVENDGYHQIREKLYDEFIRYVPRNSLADLDIVAKHSKNFYRSTGSQKSVRFLARILFNKSADLYYPQHNILKASDGKWFVEKSINIKDVAVNNVANSIAFTRFANTLIRGAQSNSTAIVENVNPYYEAGVLITELKVSQVTKDFINGEQLFCTIEDEGVFKRLTANLYSGSIVSVSLTSPGSGYIEGASVPLISANGIGGQIIIDKVLKGKLQGQIKSIQVVLPGAGYRVNDPLLFTGGAGGKDAAANVASVLDDETFHPAYYDIVGSTIQQVKDVIIANTIDTNEGFSYSNLANIYITTANLDLSTGPGSTVNIATLSKIQQNSNVYFETGDYIFARGPNTYHRIVESNRYYWELNVSPGLVGSLSNVSFDVIKKPNSNSTIEQSMVYWSYGPCGPIITCAITNSGTDYVELPAVSVISNTFVRSLGILGRMEIIDGGVGYEVGDQIEFINPYGTYGIGAVGEVSVIDANGTITQVNFVDDPGQGHLPGGSGYNADLLPTANVISANALAYGANIAVIAIIGDGSSLNAKSNVVGSIASLKIVSRGVGYDEAPILDLSTQGDGLATAYANVVTGIYSYQGRYLNQDGQLSSFMFLEDRDYYQKFSYVVKIEESLNKYRKSLTDLIHPAGLKLYGEYLFEDNNETSVNTVNVINTAISTGVNASSLIVLFDGARYLMDQGNNILLADNVWYNSANTNQYANVSNTVYYKGGGFQFDAANGVNNRVSMNHANSMNVSNSLTVIAWFYQDKSDIQYKTIVSKQNPTFTKGFEINSQNNNINVIVRPYNQNNILTLTSTANANTWYMAGFTYDGSHVQGYLNGEFVGITGNVSSGSTDSSNNFYIGARNDSANTMNGKVAIIEVYSRPLSNTEILKEYQRYSGRFGL